MTNLIEELKNAGYVFAGIATPETNPSDTAKVFYVASENGTYSNFDGIVLPDEIAILYRADATCETSQRPLNVKKNAHFVLLKKCAFRFDLNRVSFWRLYQAEMRLVHHLAHSLIITPLQRIAHVEHPLDLPYHVFRAQEILS